MKRTLAILLCLALVFGASACARQDDSAGTPLVFQDDDAAAQALLSTGASGEDLSSAEVDSLLTGDALRDLEGYVSLNADATLDRVELMKQAESRTGKFMLIRELIWLYPGALPFDDFSETCTVFDTPVDAARWEPEGSVAYTASFVRPDTGVAVCATVFCYASEGDQSADCVRRLFEITEQCLDPENTLTLDSVYSGPDFPRRAETALTPISPETEAALRAGAREAMERFQAAAAADPVIPTECVCDSMIIRAVSPEGEAMLVDAETAYLPIAWEWSDVDDGSRFADSPVPGWYTGHPVQTRGAGERSDWLVGTQSFLMQRGPDGTWQVADGGLGGPVKNWLDNEHAYDAWTRVRWTV